MFKRRQKLNFFNHWKQSIFLDVTSKTAKMQKIIFHKNKNEEIKQQNQKEKIARSMQVMLVKKLAKNCFIELFDHMC